MEQFELVTGTLQIDNGVIKISDSSERRKTSRIIGAILFLAYWTPMGFFQYKRYSNNQADDSFLISSVCLFGAIIYMCVAGYFFVYRISTAKEISICKIHSISKGMSYYNGFPHVKLILGNKKKRIVEFIGNEDLRFIDYLNKYGLKIEDAA